MHSAVLLSLATRKSTERDRSPRAGPPAIRMAAYLRPGNVFLVVLSDGRSYQLRREWLDMLDRTEILSIAVERSGRFFSIKQRSGRRTEIPWDRVLYHCDSAYEYYQGRRKQLLTASHLEDRIKQARRRAGLTQASLAKLTGMQRSNIARIESGRHRPSLDTLEKIARRLRLSVADLVRD